MEVTNRITYKFLHLIWKVNMGLIVNLLRQFRPISLQANEVKILESYCEAGVWDSAVSFAAGREGIMFFLEPHSFK